MGFYASFLIKVLRWKAAIWSNASIKTVRSGLKCWWSYSLSLYESYVVWRNVEVSHIELCNKWKLLQASYNQQKISKI